MNPDIPDLENEKFNDYEKLYKKERFYLELFSEKIKFSEIYKYFDYLNEATEYITMHKTKGSGIKDVLTFLDEYFWNKYNFKTKNKSFIINYVNINFWNQRSKQVPDL